MKKRHAIKVDIFNVCAIFLPKSIAIPEPSHKPKKGSGIPAGEIRELIKQYNQSKKVVKMFKGSKGDISKFMKKFGGKLPIG